MRRHYFVSDDLDDLEVLQAELEKAGVSTPRIHVLSAAGAEVAHHQLHEVQSFMMKDVVHSTTLGAGVGICAFVLILSLAFLSGWTDTVGWSPFVFLAIVLLGFCAWEGGLIGIQKPNHHFRRFEETLGDGKHVFFVDLEPHQEAVLEKVLEAHPRLERAGTGSAVPQWLVTLQEKFGMIRHT